MTIQDSLVFAARLGNPSSVGKMAFLGRGLGLGIPANRPGLRSPGQIQARPGGGLGFKSAPGINFPRV
eukprot:1185782-Prorocentrum_minimum.AAC.1